MGFWLTWNRYNAATKRHYRDFIEVIHFNSFLKQRDKIHTAITIAYNATEGGELIDRKRIFKISYKPF